MLTTLDFGSQVDLLNKSELRDALREDAVERSILRGVKEGELFINQGWPGMGANVFVASGAVPQCPAAGFVWAVMNVGLELSGASNARLWKAAVPGGAPTGNSRAVGVTSQSQSLNGFTFSKGQFTLRAGDVWTVSAVTGAINILSVFMAYIEVTAEEAGKLWI